MKQYGLLDSYLNTTSLVQHQTESFNRFLDSSIQKVVARQNLIEPSVEGFALKLGNVRLDRVSIIESDGSRRGILPNEARLRNLTYATPIFIEVVPIIRGIEKTAAYGEVFVGEIPIMIRSNLCNTKTMARSQLIENGEDPEDPGGYFIIKGVERVLIGLEDVAPNRIITTRESDGKEIKSRVFSTTPGFRARCVVTRSQSGVFSVDFPTTSKSLDLIMLLRALGLKADDILNYANDLLPFKNDMLLNMETSEAKDLGPKEALLELGKMAAPGQASKYQEKRAEMQLDNYLLPHIGGGSEDRMEKGKYLVQMARKATIIGNKLARQDDKDHYANKRVKFAGELMEELFAYAFRFFVKEVKYQIERTSARGRKLSIQAIINPDTLTEKIAYAMGTGTWVAGQTGVSQVLDRTNFISSYTHLRRVKSPLAKKHPHFRARDVHGTQWGKICPSETPEGQEVGLTKYLAIMSKVTVGAEESQIEQKLKELHKVEQIKVDHMAKDESPRCYLYLNGRIMGYVEDPEKYVAEIRDARRKGLLSGEVNVAYMDKLHTININTDKGRIRKAYIIVENGKHKMTAEIEDKIHKKEIDFNSLLRNGIIEYLDAEEEENALVAFEESEITEKTTHMEIDVAAIFGFTVNTSPFPEHNNIARHAMLANFTKQAEGLYMSNFNVRFDSRAYLLFYPQAPIVTTAAYEGVGIKHHPSGQNFVVALSTYYGYNMADAIVVNKAAIDRGLGRSIFYKTYVDEERRYPGGQKDKFKMPPPTAEGYMGEHVYSKLGDDGIIEPEMHVEEGDALIGKVAPPRFLEENIGAGGLEEKMRDDSSILKTGETGDVDSVVFTESTGATKIVKVRVRSLRVPEKGDKFASRHGQKGVIAMVVPQEDMPFTEQGVIPDLLLNPHSIPTRLTFGHLLEELAGKAGSLEGKSINGTAFAEDGQVRMESYSKMLEKHGFDRNGEETLYDGITGIPFKSQVFTGVVYYNRLYHMVSNKIQVRSRGKVQILTHQPTEGKARQGALRFGEMERDALIGYGASLLLKERLLDQSDKAEVLICKECGDIGYYDRIKKIAVCPLCGSNSFAEVEISYAFKILLDEIKSLHIMPRIKLNV